jgi:hypothetical protein
MSERESSTRDLAEVSHPDTAADADAGPNEADAYPGGEGARAERPMPDEAPSTHASEEQQAPLLPDDQSREFTARWQEIQVRFVDEPRDSVAQADALVADLMQRLAARFADERERLEGQWDRGDDVSTEDLRVALTRYRAFFDRLLSA